MKNPLALSGNLLVVFFLVVIVYGVIFALVSNPNEIISKDEIVINVGEKISCLSERFCNGEIDRSELRKLIEAQLRILEQHENTETIVEVRK